MLRRYWEQQAQAAYHHTAPITMVYALREGLRLLMEEGLKERYRRHAQNAQALRAGLEAMRLLLLAKEGHRLPCLTAVGVPEGVDDLEVRRLLIREANIEISGGLGEQTGRVWRLGLMGYNSTPGNLFTLLSALEWALGRQGYEVAAGAAVAAAQQALRDGPMSA